MFRIHMCLTYMCLTYSYGHHLYTWTYRGQKKMLEPLELKLQRIMRTALWVLAIELGFFGRTVSTLSC